MLIRTMGLFWKRDDVFWGRQKNRGTLFGLDPKAKKEEPVDFWSQVGVYALYADFHLVYVGQASSSIGVRLRAHLKDDLAGRWDTFSWFGVRKVIANSQLSALPDVRLLKLSEILNHIEGILIASAEPPLNGQGGRFKSDVTRYIQYRDKRLGLSNREILEKLYDSKIY